MAQFKIKCSKNKAQTEVTIKQTDSTDLSSVSSMVVSTYSDDLSTADSTYTITASELSSFKSTGEMSISVSDLIEGTIADDFYTFDISGDSGTYLSNKAGIGYTLEAKGKSYSKQGFVDVYAPDFRIDRVLHTVHMLVAEMDAIEDQEPSLQKRIDFTSRLAILKQMLRYD